MTYIRRPTMSLTSIIMGIMMSPSVVVILVITTLAFLFFSRPKMHEGRPLPLNLPLVLLIIVGLAYWFVLRG